jgi:hypothetical protein
MFFVFRTGYTGCRFTVDRTTGTTYATNVTPYQLETGGWMFSYRMKAEL